MERPYEGELRVLGEWWLPGTDRKVAGILRFSQEYGGELELIGSFRDMLDHMEKPREGVFLGTEKSLARSGTYDRIVGRAGGKSFTLEGCFRTHLSNLLVSGPGSTVERIHVNQAIRGAEFEAGEPLEATGLSFRLLHLVHFIGQGGVAEKHYFEGKVPEGEADVTIEIRRTTFPEIQLPNDMSLVLSEGVSMSGDRIAGRAVERDFFARLSGKRQDLQEYVDVASDLQDLVSIGTAKTAAFEELSFFHPDVERELTSGERFPIAIDYFAQWATTESRDPKIDRFRLLFFLNDLGGAEFFALWAPVARAHRSSLGRVMGTRYRKGLFASDRLLNRAAALEAFDRVREGAGRAVFRQRMARCASLAGDTFEQLVGNVPRWIDAFKNERDAIAHHADRHPAEAGEVDYYLADSAYFLFVLCMLREAGAPAGVFSRIAQDQSFQFTSRRLQEVLDARA